MQYAKSNATRRILVFSKIKCHMFFKITIEFDMIIIEF
jgi:hypothetical protein